jgi:enoyl-CoA hydratase/carnithine racemase
MSSGRRITAEEALGWGLVTEVAEAGGFEARIAEYAAALAAMPTKAIGWNKRLFDYATTATLDEQLELEAQLQAVAVQTADFAEGVAAFLEKRAPSFKGA